MREVLTECGIDVILRQVEPWPEQRAELREVAGTDVIPVLRADDGSIHRGTREIFAYLATLEPGRYAVAHRDRYAEHRPARAAEVPGRLIESYPWPQAGSSG